MKFGNVVLYSKGWYQHRGDSDKVWMDLIHCISADGWTLFNKKEVVTWCLHRLDEMKEDELLRNNKNMLSLSRLYEEVNRCKSFWNYWHHDEELSTDDAIIAVFLSTVSCLEKTCFSEGVRPSELVLPLTYRDAYYDDGKYNTDHKPSFKFAQMHCDVMKRIEEFFPDSKEQDPKSIYFIEDFETIESNIRGKKIEDVLVLNGSDNLNDCIEVTLGGDDIIHNFYIFVNRKKVYLDKGIYEHCIDFSNNTQYTVRIQKKESTWDWDEPEYVIRSIKKA